MLLLIDAGNTRVKWALADGKAAPGTWTLRALSRAGNGQATLVADGPGLHRAEVSVA